MSEWKSALDVEKDLWLFSEISEHNDDMDEPPPASILQWNARIGANHNASIFDTHVPSEDITYVSSGRGRGGISKIFKPGIPVPAKDSREDEHTVYRYLREVSGLGYSNELIEKSFKKSTPVPIDLGPSCEIIEKSSKKTTPLSMEQEFCDVSETEDERLEYISKSPEKINSTSTSITSPKSNSSLVSTPSISSIPSSPVEEKIVEQHPPPLSVILNRGKKKEIPKTSKADKENTTRMKEYTLNPEAPEFQCSGLIQSDTGVLLTTPPTRSLKEISKNQIKAELKISNGMGARSVLNSSSSSGEELPWRRRDANSQESSPRKNGTLWSDFTETEKKYNFRSDGKKNTDSNRSFSDRPRRIRDDCEKSNGTNKSFSDTPWRIRDAGGRNNVPNKSSTEQSWRIRDDKLFDIKSDDDFPAL